MRSAHDNISGIPGILSQNLASLTAAICDRIPHPKIRRTDSKRFSEYYFHPSFFDGVFRLTGGHVGAIYDFVEIVATDNVCFFMISEHIT